MMKNIVPEGLKAAVFGVLAVTISFPLLWALHRAFALGPLALTGVIVLGGTVVVCFALAGMIGAATGSARGNAWIAALLSLVMAITVCAVAAPFYGSLVVEGITRDATGLLSGERQQVQDATVQAVQNGARSTWQATREGRLREQLAKYQQQAQNATTPEARAEASKRASELAVQVASLAKTKGVALLKAGTARVSSFAFLIWPLVGCPLLAALACRNTKRR